MLEGVKRSPGKSKFSIPRKEAPPIDGSYLDRLFADYEKQAQELQGQSGEAVTSPLAQSPEPPAIVEQPKPEGAEASSTLLTSSPIAEISGQLSPASPVVPFPQEETTDNQWAEPTAALLPQVTTATKAPAIKARLPKEKPAAAPSEALDDDTKVLDKWKRKYRLSKGEISVLRVMLGMCREAGGNAYYIKIPQLMQAAELRERQTQLVLRNLRELGLIEKVTEYSNLDRLGTRYRVVFDAD